jgi:hypothetical protein
MVVFPKPVMSETLTEFRIVTSLPMTRRSTVTNKMSALPTTPNCSNISISPFYLSLGNDANNVYEPAILTWRNTLLLIFLILGFYVAYVFLFLVCVRVEWRVKNRRA